MKKIGFIGLGNMGLSMALHLCKAGYPLLVCSGNKENEKKIVEAGGKTADSYAELARLSDIVITIVPADAEVLDLYTSENGLIENMKDGAVCIDMTSARGITKKLIASHAEKLQKHIGVIDAPVSGGVTGAQAGTLTVMAGCERELFDRYREIFEPMSKKIIYTGELGTASDIKMINQILYAVHTSIVSEALCVADQLGVDKKILFDVVNESSGSSFVTKNVVPVNMLTGDHTAGFRLELMKKDIGLFTETARQNHAFSPISTLIDQIFTAASNQGLGELNVTGVQKWFQANQPYVKGDSKDMA